MAKGKRAHRPVTPAKGSAARPATATNARPVERATNTTAKTPAAPAPATPRTPATNGARATTGAQARPRAGASNAHRRMRATPWWRRGRTPLYGTIAIVVLLIAVFVYIANNQTPNIGASPAANNVVNTVTHVDPKVISAVGTGGVTNQLKVVTGAALLKGSGGKPEVAYIGAGYCPYCAAQRWSMIIALSRFGTFKGLQFTHSSTSDIYPNTSTFTFYGSTYTSQYIDFVPVEETGQDQNTILQTPTDAQQNLLNTYDSSQYVGNQAGGIPFIDYGNRFISVSSGYSPQLLTGQSWQDIANALSNANNVETQNIVGNANYMTAAICTLTNNQPASVCAAAPIPTIEQQIQKGS